MKKINYYVVYSLVIAVLSACAATPKTRQFYTLTSPARAAEVEAFALTGGLGIGPVELPEFLLGKNIVSVVDSQQLYKSQTHLWAGNLQKTVSRTLAADLSQQLALADVWPFPWDSRHRPERQISILIEQLDGPLGGSVTLAAKWILLDEQGARVVKVGRQEFSSATTDNTYAAYVAAINQVVHQLAAALEQDVRQHWDSDTQS